jgi:hypothetical protein
MSANSASRSPELPGAVAVLAGCGSAAQDIVPGGGEVASC